MSVEDPPSHTIKHLHKNVDSPSSTPVEGVEVGINSSTFSVYVNSSKSSDTLDSVCVRALGLLDEVLKRNDSSGVDTY